MMIKIDLNVCKINEPASGIDYVPFDVITIQNIYQSLREAKKNGARKNKICQREFR